MNALIYQMFIGTYHVLIYQYCDKDQEYNSRQGRHHSDFTELITSFYLEQEK